MINSIVSQGLIWAILGLGIFMTFRILDFPDMTTEGSFPLGGAVAVTLITKGVNPLLATLAAIGAGCLAGLATGLLYTKGRIPTLLSGILVMTSCNSVILFVMQRANLGLLGYKKIQEFLPFASGFNEILIGLIFVTLVILGLIFFLDTRLGQAYIATGDNPDMAKSFGINTDGPTRRLCGCFTWDWCYRYRACQPHYWRGALFKCYLDRALAQYCDRIDRLPIFDLGRDCAWHQYQLYSNLQCLDLGYLPDDSNL